MPVNDGEIDWVLRQGDGLGCTQPHQAQHRTMGSSYTNYTYRWKTVHQRGSLVEGTRKPSAEGQQSTASWGKKGKSSPSPQTPCFPSKLPSQGPSLWKLCLVLLPSHAWEDEAMTSLETSYGIHMEVSQTDCANEMSQKRY